MAKIIMQEEAGTPSTPSTGKWSIYLKSDGLYVIDDAGTEIGPIIKGIPYVTPGTSGNVLTSNGSTWISSAASGGEESRIVQVVHTQTGAVATGTTVIPNDDTKPQNNEGDEYMTLAITPTSATNKLFIQVTWIGSHSAATPLGVCLFHDSVADADAATLAYVDTATGVVNMVLNHEMVAGTTSAMTFKVRAGGIASGTTTFNGSVGGRKFGGALASSIRISEVLV